MRKFNYFLLIFIFAAGFGSLSAQTFEYVSPKNNSILNSLNTNIILKSGENIDSSSLSQNEFAVIGSKSGVHQGEVKLSDDNKTVLFNPDIPFSANELVSVTVNPGIKTVDGTQFQKLSFHFSTTPLTKPLDADKYIEPEADQLAQSITSSMRKSPAQSASVDSLPSDFPQITVGTSDNPSEGKIFITNQLASSLNKSIGNYLMILNNDGTVDKYKQLSQPAGEFKVQPNGELSFSYRQGINWILLDTSLAPVDTFRCGNGYSANLHDFVLLPNGHALLFAYDPEPVDMSNIVPDGDPDAVVTGAVIQEIDADKNVVFQWRTWDYIPITDSYFNLSSANIDLVHMNGLAVDKDGNILASMRHLSAIVKINRQTGNIMWILGGKENQFNFINEHASNAPTYFSYQHDIDVLANGDITLFDNGNQHSPQYSRGVEYKLDEQNKTATLVWEYRHTPDIFTSAMGSVERLSNGNTLIGWGIANGDGIPVFTEVHPDNSTALEMFLPKGQISYRSLKFPWVSQAPSAGVTSYEVLQGNTYSFNNSQDSTGVVITFNKLDAMLYANASVSKFNYAPLNPRFNTNSPVLTASYFKIINGGINSFTGLVKVNLKNYPSIVNPQQTFVYVRPDGGSTFTALPTAYDSLNDQLTFTATAFGEYAFGVPQTIVSYPPSPISPADSETVNGLEPVNLSWASQGVAHSFRIQIASDSLFNSLVADTSGLTETEYTLNTVKNNSTYFWRLQSSNVNGNSDWTSAYRFYTSSPFIKVESPSGGESVYIDSTYIIRWASNVSDTVNIVLMKGNNVVSVIGDTVFSKTNAFEWQVPSSILGDSTYKIIISSITNPGLSAASESSFTITDGVTGIKDAVNAVKSYKLSQNYPNPFNPSTVINYQLPVYSKVVLKVYDILGNEVAMLVNGEQMPGSYNITWNASGLSSGIYFYSLKSTSRSGSDYFRVRKMILLK